MSIAGHFSAFALTELLAVADIIAILDSRGPFLPICALAFAAGFTGAHCPGGGRPLGLAPDYPHAKTVGLVVVDG
jgi:hypothetical protein